MGYMSYKLLSTPPANRNGRRYSLDLLKSGHPHLPFNMFDDVLQESLYVRLLEAHPYERRFILWQYNKLETHSESFNDVIKEVRAIEYFKNREVKYGYILYKCKQDEWAKSQPWYSPEKPEPFKYKLTDISKFIKTKMKLRG